ncbi:hypothetical protein APR04_001982 [Promicromonospora umidemergens]|uniref:Uncharacterized protein n=1 Tax=Promicromonospora umidemergens TaxID=629679 RepID=A0ABP8XBS4_9MICO|nr:hypothetical protein [Promicromonospora umidemergens]MCP2283079.1 hypothetical protein [Promicromonospora umidemergens]
MHLSLLIAGLPLTVLAGGMGVAMLVVAPDSSGYAPLLANTSALGFPVIASVVVVTSQLIAPGLRLDPASAPGAHRSRQPLAGWMLMISAVSTSWIISEFSGTGIDSDRQANGMVFEELLLDCWPLLLSAAAMVLCGVLFRLTVVSRVVPVALFVVAVAAQRGLW